MVFECVNHKTLIASLLSTAFVTIFCASKPFAHLSAPPFPLALSCPAQLRDGDDGDAPRETVFLQLSRDGAGWHGETDNVHIDTLHSSATPRALRLSPLIQLPLLLLLLSRSPPPGAAGRSHPPGVKSRRWPPNKSFHAAEYAQEADAAQKVRPAPRHDREPPQARNT